MRQKLNIITLGVKDLDKALDFYEKGLGWNKSNASHENLALFPLGGIVLAPYSRQLLADDANLKNESTGFPGITISYNAKSEKEVDSVLEEVQKLGASIIKPAQKVFWGGYSGYFKDLDGHLFEIAYNPLWKLDNDDNLDLP